MKKNIGTIERGVRIVFGLGITSLAFVGPQNLWFLLGLVPLSTGLIGWCPPYDLLGINTNKSCGGCSEPKANCVEYATPTSLIQSAGKLSGINCERSTQIGSLGVKCVGQKTIGPSNFEVMTWIVGP